MLSTFDLGVDPPPLDDLASALHALGPDADTAHASSASFAAASAAAAVLHEVACGLVAPLIANLHVSGLGLNWDDETLKPLVPLNRNTWRAKVRSVNPATPVRGAPRRSLVACALAR